MLFDIVLNHILNVSDKVILLIFHPVSSSVSCADPENWESKRLLCLLGEVTRPIFSNFTIIWEFKKPHPPLDPHMCIDIVLVEESVCLIPNCIPI